MPFSESMNDTTILEFAQKILQFADSNPDIRVQLSSGSQEWGAHQWLFLLATNVGSTGGTVEEFKEQEANLEDILNAIQKATEPTLIFSFCAGDSASDMLANIYMDSKGNHKVEIESPASRDESDKIEIIKSFASELSNILASAQHRPHGGVPSL